MNSDPTLTLGIVFSDLSIREQGSGKNTLVGSFGAYNLPQIPCAVPPFFATAFITNVSGDIKELNVTARVENPQNGIVLASTAAKIQFSRPPARDDVTEISIPIFNLAFPAPGLYKVVISVNNEKVGERNLPVNDSRTPPQTA